MKSSIKLEQEIEALLRQSNWYGNGPHGTTINAIMKRVKIIRKRTRARLRIVKKAS